jgi:hypothetical protein
MMCDYMGNTSSELPNKATIVFNNIDSKPNLRNTKRYVNTYANFKSLNPPVKTSFQSVHYDQSGKKIICHVKLSKTKNVTTEQYETFIKDDLRGPFESSWSNAPHENMYAKNISVIFDLDNVKQPKSPKKQSKKQSKPKKESKKQPKPKKESKKQPKPKKATKKKSKPKKATKKKSKPTATN